ncbi:hypothetical protein [Corynebacterium sp. UBA4397]|uniref:hypothetical protein n=1 Tax=Corynebacterium sp. UBA4397 TaxID=1946394 RepID=UPI00257A117D|nr:hypothetical protein [Corynebacterium sp. UBA4397]
MARIGVNYDDSIVAKRFFKVLDISSNIVAKLSYLMFLQYRANWKLANVDGANAAVFARKLEPVRCTSIP